MIRPLGNKTKTCVLHAEAPMDWFNGSPDEEVDIALIDPYSTTLEKATTNRWSYKVSNAYGFVEFKRNLKQHTRCLAHSYFDQTLTTEETVESAWAKLRGSLLHYSCRSLGSSELRVQMIHELDGEPITIVGHVDAYEPETATTYDLKTTRFVKWQSEKGFIPRENHITQVQCYHTLLDLYGIPVNRLVLIYADDQTILPKQVPLGSRREWMINRATALHHAF